MGKKYQFVDEGKKHLHTLDGVPLYGTSTVVGILAKPLTWWAAGLAVAKFGWRNPKKETEEACRVALEAGYDMVHKLSLIEYGTLLNDAYRAHADNLKVSADVGIDMHAELEKYVKACLAAGGAPLAIEKSDELHKAVELFAEWSLKNVEQFLFSEGHCYSEKHWVGGITDAGAKMKKGGIAIIDFKSTDAAYYSQFVQEGGYAVQVEENGILTREGGQILPPFKADELIIVPFRNAKIAPRSVQNVEGFKQSFLGALLNYQMSSAFDE